MLRTFLKAVQQKIAKGDPTDHLQILNGNKKENTEKYGPTGEKSMQTERVPNSVGMPTVTNRIQSNFHGP